MKTYTFILILFCLKNGVNSQSINLGFNSTYTGRNITSQFEKQKKKCELSIGLGYNINKLAHNDDQNYIYKKRLYATKPIHYINLSITYQHYFGKNRIKNLMPFVFYDLQAKYSTTRNRSFTPIGYDSTISVNNPDEAVIYKEKISFFGPFFWLENTIGFGFKVEINDRIYIKQRLGTGINLIFGHDNMVRFNWQKRPNLEFANYFNVSIGYRLKN